MVGAGINHFVNPPPYLGMMPAEIPASWHLALVYVSGIAEIAGGLGLILPATRRAAAWGLIALLIAVFPANLNMAVNQLPLGTDPVPSWALWARLPLQVVFVAWAYWIAREPRARATG
ncbi:MAG: DoxX family rane protein [Myxococcales bacterium]|nr:DoxX family rane protein [Myxococcales bacterium]